MRTGIKYITLKLRLTIILYVGGVLTLLFSGSTAGLVADEVAPVISKWTIVPHSMITKEENPRQRFGLFIDSTQKVEDVLLQIETEGKIYAELTLGPLLPETNCIPILVPETLEERETQWRLLDGNKKILAEQSLKWTPPRRWTFYLLSSSHVDIGLHKSQYLQRKMSTDYIERIKTLCDETSNRPEESQFRYNIEGFWFWSNYAKDYGEAAAQDFVDRYIKTDRVSVGTTLAGNHTQAYGFEELCRSTYYRRELNDRWGIDRDTMVMADNNGLTWSLVQPYADAGIKNILWLPNKWNPAPVKGSRIDTSWTGPLPLLFYWQGADKESKVLLWLGDHYGGSAEAIGLNGYAMAPPKDLIDVERVISKQMRIMEQHYPYDIWLFSKYYDDEAPNTGNADFVRRWNEKWEYPHFITVGNLSVPFAKLQEKYRDVIPTLTGDIPCGWAQHTVCAPELLAQKFAADRLLPTAEKVAVLARLVNSEYVYPQQAFRQAWDCLLANDEHSYGTSGYKGRDVYETWLQHRDWIDKAEETATTELDRAIKALANKIPATVPSLLLFNPTLMTRVETIEVPAGDNKTALIQTPEIPPLGYVTVPVPNSSTDVVKKISEQPPVLENDFYRLVFDHNGALSAIFDKELKRELLDGNAPWKCNQFVYTKDNHVSFTSPQKATFELLSDDAGETVVVSLSHPESGAKIVSRIRLPKKDKRIEIDNQFNHIHDLFNAERYYRFGYTAFPFAVDDFEFHAQLNGCIVRPKIDRTGHTTDAYTAVREWSSVGNKDFTIALIQLDSTLTEFGKIHANKIEFNVPAASSHIYSYLFTDWLQMHTNGGSAICPRFRYCITSGPGTWQDMKIPQLARRISQPVVVGAITVKEKEETSLPANRHSFLSCNSNDLRLLTLKLAETPGDGILARFMESSGQTAFATLSGLTENATLTRCSVIERNRANLESASVPFKPFEYQTIRMTFPKKDLSECAAVVQEHNDVSISIRWPAVPNAVQYNVYRGEAPGFVPDEYHLIATTTSPEYINRNLGPGETYYYRIAPLDSGLNQGPVSSPLPAETDKTGSSAPAPVGSITTGLVTEPRAVSGDNFDQLYLEWGQNMESDMDHYELYRSTQSGFTPNEETFVSNVEQGIWRIVRYEDRGLPEFTTVYYRVRAVDKDGNAGPFSNEFSGTTREPYWKHP